MICCVTGNRPFKFPFEYSPNNSLYKLYISQVHDIVYDLINNGYFHFISGMAQGVDLDFAEIIIKARDIYPHIQLEAAIPHPQQTAGWQPEDVLRYDTILNKSDAITIVSPHYTKWCMQKRNRYMVDRSDTVIAVWNGQKSGGTWNTIQYADKSKKLIRYLLFSNLLL